MFFAKLIGQRDRKLVMMSKSLATVTTLLSELMFIEHSATTEYIVFSSTQDIYILDNKASFNQIIKKVKRALGTWWLTIIPVLLEIELQSSTS